MQTDIDAFIALLAEADTSEMLKSAFLADIRALGYDGYDAWSYALSPDLSDGLPNFLVASYSPTFLETYLQDGHAEICPVLAELMHAMVPFDYLAFLERAEQSSSVTWQRRMLRFNRVEAAWCIPMNAVGALRSVTVYMRNRGMHTRRDFEATREEVSGKARYYMQAMLSFRVATGLRDNTITAKPDLLSARERDCLRYLMQGKTNPEIAEHLAVSRNTVHFHLKNLYRKMNVSSRMEAVTAARAWGFAEVA